MRLWPLGFVAIALFALLAAYGEREAMPVARSAFGVVLTLFVLWLLWSRTDRDRRED
jgi:hypothetical protein